MRKIYVPTVSEYGSGAGEVWVCSDPVQVLKDAIEQFSASQVLVVTEETVWEAVKSKIGDSFQNHPLLILKPGEETKTVEGITKIWTKLTEIQADRSCLLLNLGGGVISDLGGFAASCWKRGIRYFNIPTTLLAQVDASVGGKTGINFSGFKNQIGTFSVPSLVLISTLWFDTLGERQITSGYVEMLKHGLVNDLGFYNVCNILPESPEEWEDRIYRSIQIKLHIVKQDPYDQHFRQVLNFGHTVGHALESVAFHEGIEVLHGEAVALGMLAETLLSEKYCGLYKQEKEDILKRVNSLKIDYQGIKDKFNETVFIKSLFQDKKNSHNQITMTGLSKIGFAKTGVVVQVEDVLQAIYQILN